MIRSEKSAHAPVTPNEKVLVFIPMYNCEKQIPRVIKQFDDPRVQACISALVCVDNQSTDGTVQSAIHALETCPIPEKYVVQNEENYGLGGSHKSAINFARENGYEHLIVLHGDDQGSIDGIIPLIQTGQHREYEALLGARFMKESKLVGYAFHRTFVNHVFNWIFSLVTGKRLHDLGSGLNYFRTSIFSDHFHEKYADNLTFNYFLIIGMVAKGVKYQFFPIIWREDDQVSNAKLFQHGLQMLRLLRDYILNRQLFLKAEHRTLVHEGYSSRTLKSWPEQRVAV